MVRLLLEFGPLLPCYLSSSTVQHSIKLLISGLKIFFLDCPN